MDAALQFLNLTSADAVMIPVGFAFFLVFLFFFRRGFVEPYVTLVEAREAATSGAVDASVENAARAADLTQQFDRAISQAYAEGAQRKAAEVATAKAKADQVLQGAKNEAESILKNKRAELSRKLETDPDLKNMLSQTDNLVEAAVQKLLQGPRLMGVIFTLFIAGLATFMPDFAYAASGEHHEPSIMEVLILWANFVIFLIILRAVAKKPLATLWHTRRQEIIAAVNTGQAKLLESENALKAAQAKYSSIAQETQRIAANLSDEAKRESETVIENALQESTRIRERAQALAAAEERAFFASVKEELAERVVNAVRERVRGAMTPEKEKAFRDSALGGVKSLLQ